MYQECHAITHPGLEPVTTMMMATSMSIVIVPTTSAPFELVRQVICLVEGFSFLWSALMVGIQNVNAFNHISAGCTDLKLYSRVWWKTETN
jgi:hypothetical protein